MRILFLGAVDFSRHCLNEVVRCGGEVVAVLTLDRQAGQHHSDYADLRDPAGRFGIPVHTIRRINDADTVALIRSLRPEVMLVFGWSQLLSKAVLEIPARGCIGAHPALLPKDRGRHPLIWPLVRGADRSGLTFFYLDDGADSGDILWQRPFPITLEDDAGTLYEKIKGLATEAIREFLPRMKEGNAPRQPQDHRQATYGRKRSEPDGEVRWERSTVETHNLVRALARPYVGAHTYVDGHKVVIWRSRPGEGPLPQGAEGAVPGTVVRQAEGGVDVRTGNGFLRIVDFEISGDHVTLAAGTRLGLGPAR